MGWAVSNWVMGKSGKATPTYFLQKFITFKGLCQLLSNIVINIR